METIRAILVDDENHCIQTLRYDLTRLCPHVEVIAESTSGEDAVEKINTFNPDLIFLDIEMPGMSGFELLRRLMPISFEVIFVTAYDQYAIQAFRYAALDYLLKPVVGDQLKEAVARVMAHRHVPEQSVQLDTLMHNLRAGLRSPRIALPSGRGMDFVNSEDILYCIADSNYTHIRIRDGKKYTCSKTLKDIEHLLIGLTFFRIHQSYLINMSHVQRYLRDNGGYVVMSDGFRIPIAKRRKEEFMALLKSE
ncbi:MAG TPA: LytTR family DNA-binding domain-containing protein [Saprospiraceae bacterium]|nr:LytTR family DNA-binding domain-containing protein [Saprospiraceae bacterium]